MDDSMIDEKFDMLFPEEKDCFEYLKNLRWPNGFVCPNPKCQNDGYWPKGSNRLKCSKCKKVTSITSHTIFYRKKQTLRFWFYFIWVITHSEYGNEISNLEEKFKLDSRTTVKWVDLIHNIITKHLIPEKPSDLVANNLDIYVSGQGYNFVCLHTDLYTTANGNQIWLTYRTNDIKLLEDYLFYLDNYAVQEHDLLIHSADGSFVNISPQFEPHIKRILLYIQKYELTIKFWEKSDKLYQDYLNEISFRYNYRGKERQQFDDVLKYSVTPLDNA